MTFNEYLKIIGFEINPFQFSNADKEVEYLEAYFIKPDYFEDICLLDRASNDQAGLYRT